MVYFRAKRMRRARGCVFLLLDSSVSQFQLRFRMSFWDKDWVRGVVHTVAAVGTMGASVPISAAYEVGRYAKKKSGSDSYNGALTSASKSGDSDSANNSGGVVYDGVLADAETERRRKKGGTLTGQGESTFDTSSLG